MLYLIVSLENSTDMRNEAAIQEKFPDASAHRRDEQIMPKRCEALERLLSAIALNIKPSVTGTIRQKYMAAETI